jgi:hypothetical protein
MWKLKRNVVQTLETVESKGIKNELCYTKVGTSDSILARLEKKALPAWFE